ncbi:MAG: hypothetical protein Q8L55_15585 [Phycisphaerales bacterium]|nr:hypothetical protein [Phycisphaerales bacterium]
MASHGKGSLLKGIDGSQPAAGAAKSAGAKGSSAERKNKIVAIVCVVLLLALSVFIVTSFLGGETAASTSEVRAVIDSESGELIEKFRLPEGKSFPYVNPKTGRNTLYLAEPCFWAKDGTIKVHPTWVLLNEFAGKSGPTICPDCGKPVKSHNPYPVIR